MSFKNFDDINPLVAVFENNSRTTNSVTPYMNFDTSLYSGTVSSDTLTLEYPCTLRGDFYGSTYDHNNVNSGKLSAFAAFYVDGVEQYQSVEINAGSGWADYGGGEPFFADAPANVPIKARYRIAGTMNVTTFAKFPRITGVLTK